MDGRGREEQCQPGPVKWAEEVKDGVAGAGAGGGGYDGTL